MNAERRMQNAERRSARFVMPMSPFLRGHRGLFTRLGGRGSSSGLSLVEILIAMFIFLVGVLGVLSLFPVAMHTAGKTIGDVRANNLAQSALAQLTADCRVVLERGYVDNNITGVNPPLELLRPVGNVTDYTGCYVTLISNDGGYQQSRRIAGVDPAQPERLLLDTVNPAPWNASALPTYDADPTLCDTYVITRLGLPDSPIPGTPHEFGLNRDLAIRSFSGVSGLHAGIPIGGTGTAVVAPMLADNGTVGLATGSVLQDGTHTWTVSTATDPQFTGHNTLITSSPAPLPNAALQVRKVITNDATTLTMTRAWDVLPTGDGYRVGWPQDAFLGAVSTGTASNGSTVDYLEDSSATWVVDAHAGSYVTIMTGTGEGQCRLIASNSATQLNVAPAFGIVPDNTSTYKIARSGGFALLTSGRASKRLLPIAAAESTGYAYQTGTATAVGAATITDGSKTWTVGSFVGFYVRIITGSGARQVRQIASNTANQLTVSENWVIPPSSGDRFEIAPGALLYLPGADFEDFGASAAENGTNYQLQDATTFLVLGNAANIGTTSQITTVLPRPVPPGVQPYDPPVADPLLNYRYDTATELNRLGFVEQDISKLPDIVYFPQVRADVYFNAAGNELYGSEYSTVAIFSDSGTNPSGPVRVDVLVFRNYDNAKTLAENVRPVGFLTGYIQRP